MTEDLKAMFAVLEAKMVRWTDDHESEIASAEPVFPDALGSNRIRDLWFPLLAIADAAGGSWPEQARRSALILSAEARRDPSLPTMLLQDMRLCFLALGGPEVPSRRAVLWLVSHGDHPWQDHGLTQNALADMLKPFGIRTKNCRLGKNVAKGYQKADFMDAWSRYVPEEKPTTGMHPLDAPGPQLDTPIEPATPATPDEQGQAPLPF
jgi:hypothetical protein